MTKLSCAAQLFLLLALLMITCAPSCNLTGTGTAAHIITQDAYYLDGVLYAANPRQYQDVSGAWLYDLSGATGSVYETPSGTTTGFSGMYTISGARIPAQWETSVIWDPICGANQQESGQQPVPPDMIWVCQHLTYTEPGSNSASFSLYGSTPSTITLGGVAPFTTSGGMPTATAFDPSGNVVSSLTATSVSSGGATATFPFPTNSGTALASHIYSIELANQTTPGVFRNFGTNFISIGTTSSSSSAFGVDAADLSYFHSVCNPKTGVCTNTSRIYAAPIVTQYYSNQMVGWITGNAAIPVGSQPVAVKVYGTYRATIGAGNGQYTLTGPANAIVANSGSGSVNIVSFASNTVVKSIAVGSQPMALTLNSGNTMAYVASYGNGTMAEINLSTEAVTHTVSGLSGALSVAMDPGGSYVWVGGTNYLYKVSLSTYTIAQSIPVSGTVTSLAASNAQNELVYTLVQNCCSTSSNYVANELALSNLSTTGTHANATAHPFAAYTMNGTLPTAAATPTATAVSAQFGNGFAASSTPTGFVIYELAGHQTVITGTTATPVRGIAADPSVTMAYFAVPDSNELIAVPLP